MKTEISWTDPGKTTVKIGTESVTFHIGLATNPGSKVVLSAGINEYEDGVTATYMSTEGGKPEEKFTHVYESYAAARADFEAWAIDYQAVLMAEEKYRKEALGA
jgi:hypothetical protein